MTGQMGAQAAAEWVLDRPKSSTQWSIVKQGSSGSVLCSRGSPAVYNQPALEVVCLFATVACCQLHKSSDGLGYAATIC